MNISSEHRVAVICKPIQSTPGLGVFLERGIQKICKAQHFSPGEEIEGFDDYFYVDDGPTDYMEPKCHPATYFAFDMVMPPPWFTQSPLLYLKRMMAFDHSIVFSTSVLELCLDASLPTKLIGFAADPNYHKPHNVPRDLDWIAVWHNCGDRIAASELAKKNFPNGWVTWQCYEDYAKAISRGKCALNYLRASLVNMRVPEVMAIGTPLVTTRHADMQAIYGFVENEHYLGFEGVGEMLDKIGWMRAYPEEAMEMAMRARKFVLDRHTYFHRAMEVLNWIHGKRDPIAQNGDGTR